MAALALHEAGAAVAAMPTRAPKPSRAKEKGPTGTKRLVQTTGTLCMPDHMAMPAVRACVFLLDAMCVTSFHILQFGEHNLYDFMCAITTLCVISSYARKSSRTCVQACASVISLPLNCRSAPEDPAERRVSLRVRGVQADPVLAAGVLDEARGGAVLLAAQAGETLRI